MKTCSKCNNPRRVGGRYCKYHHAEYVRNWRKTHPLTDEQKKRDTCRSYAHVYLKRGELVKQPCDECGDENSQMHHPDYDRPLYVQWKCRYHHMKIDPSHIK